MPYFVQSDLTALLPPEWLTEALDDDADGTQDAFTVLQSYATGEIDAKLGTRYALPLPSSTALDALLKSIGVHLAVEACYERRPSAKMPESLARKVTRAWEDLAALAAGKHPLSPGLEPVKAPAVIISEDARSHYDGLNA